MLEQLYMQFYAEQQIDEYFIQYIIEITVLFQIIGEYDSHQYSTKQKHFNAKVVN